MRAWQVRAFGSLDELVLRSVEKPTVRSGHALVRVAHAGLNFADSIAVQGRYQTRHMPPFILGAELSGIVVESGDGCDIAIGTPVMAQVPTGAYAEFCLVEAGRLVPLQPTVDLAVAAAVPVSYTTAAVALFRIGQLREGQTVLVHAAAGAAGLAAIRLAKKAGAKVIAAASSAEKRGLAMAAGADLLVANRESDWVDRFLEVVPDGVDLVFDPVGGDITLQSLRVLGWGGRILLVGFAAGRPAALPANQLLVRAASACGVFWSYDREPKAIGAIQRDIAVSLARQAVTPDIGGHFAFAALKDGLAELMSGGAMGKLVLDVKDR